MIESALPISLLLVLLALLPIITLFVLLLVAEWSAPEAGAVSLFVTALVGIVGFRTPLTTAVVAGAKGVWDAVFILYVVWPALLLYQIAARAGAFDALRQGIMRFSRNELFLVLVFGWVFVSFLQGVTGFGTPVAMVVPLLLVLGVRPIYAVAAPLIGHAWGNMFGTLGVAWLATLQVIDLDAATATQAAFQTGLLLILPNLFAGVAIALMHSGWRGVRHALPMLLLISLVHGGGQAALALWNPSLANFLAVSVAFVLLYPLSRWSRYRDALPYPASKMMQASNAQVEAQGAKEVRMGLLLALLPYIVLMVVAITILVVPPINNLFGQWRVGLAFPEVATGYEVVRAGTTSYAPFAILTHPGTFLLLTALITGLVYRRRGFYNETAAVQRGSILEDLIRDAVPSSLAIIAFLVLSKLMDHSGQTEVLARGVATVVPSGVYPALAPALGVLGAFMTSSNTASNVLFAPVQQTIALIAGLPLASIIAGQNAGAAIGNAIAPANIVLGTGPAGILGQEGKVLRKTIGYTAAAMLVTGIGMLLIIWLTGG